MAKKNGSSDVEVKPHIQHTGNWNRAGGEKRFGKAIAITTIGFENIVLRHNELLDIINIHIKADEENIKLIENINVDTGDINQSEIPFRYKLFNFLIEKDLKYNKEEHIIFLKHLIKNEPNAYVDKKVPCIVWKRGFQ